MVFVRGSLLVVSIAMGCTTEVEVPVRITAPSDARTLEYELVATADGTCAMDRPEGRGARFSDAMPSGATLRLERGASALWVGAWEGECGEARCFAACTSVEVPTSAPVMLTLEVRDCSLVCGEGDPDGGMDAGGLDGAVDGGLDGAIDGGLDGGLDGGPDGGTPPRVTVASSHFHTCANRFGAVTCWGNNENGRSGASASASVGPTPVMLPGAAGTALEVDLGEAHGCALMSNRTVWCWGADGGDHDRLGDGSTGMDRHVPVAVSNVEGVSDLAVGFWHACAAQSDGLVRCWGQNASNELGTGCTSGCAQIDGSSEVAEITGAIRVAAGSGSSCAVRGEARELWCWGFNPSSQLGFTSAEIRAVASPVRDGSMDVTGVELVEGGGGQNFQNADTSGFRGHLCAIREGTLWCWGANDRGQSSDDSAVMIAPTPLTALADVTSVSVGNRHTCAIYSGGLTCWGNNDSGQLGFAGGDRRGPRAVPILGLPHAAVSVAAGADHTCAALSDDSVWCWGDNAQRQLGSEGASTATPTEVPL